MCCNFHTWLAQLRRRDRLPSKSSSSSASTRPAGCDNDFIFYLLVFTGVFSGDGVRTRSGCAWASSSRSSTKSSLRTRTGACRQSPCKGVRDRKVSASYLGCGLVDEGPSILPLEKLRYISIPPDMDSDKGMFPKIRNESASAACRVGHVTTLPVVHQRKISCFDAFP